jgi:hypothetical protein
MALICPDISVANGAEISAAKHKKGRTKLCGQEKSSAKFLPDLTKRAEKGVDLF